MPPSDDPNLPAIATAEATKVWAGQLGRFMDTVFGPAATEAGELLGQEVKLWKAMNLMRHAARLEAALEKRGLDRTTVRHLGFAEAVPLIDAASYEDSEEVQALWVELLANALDPKEETVIERVFISILKEIGPCEAGLLDLLYRHGHLNPVLNFGAEESFEAVTAWRSRFDAERRVAALVNLRRLGCVGPHFDIPDMHQLLEYESFTEGLPDGPRTINLEGLRRTLEEMLVSVHYSHGSDAFPESPILDVEGRKERCGELGLTITALGNRLLSATKSPPNTG